MDREGSHNKTLLNKSTHLNNNDFLIRMLYRLVLVICIRSNRSPLFISFLFMLVFCKSCVWQLLNKQIYDDDDDDGNAGLTLQQWYTAHIRIYHWLSLMTNTTVHGGIQTNRASGYAVTHAISSTGVSNLFDHWAKWSIFKEIVGLIKQISPTGLVHPTVYSDSSCQKWTETGNVWLQCSAYIVSNNLRENTHEYRENWPKFWVISWTTFCPKFCTKFCPSCGRNHCQQLCLCFRWITDHWHTAAVH